MTVVPNFQRHIKEGSNIYYTVQGSQSQPLLSVKLIQSTSFFSCSIRFNIIFRKTHRPSRWSTSFRFSSYISVGNNTWYSLSFSLYSGRCSNWLWSLNTCKMRPEPQQLLTFTGLPVSRHIQRCSDSASHQPHTQTPACVAVSAVSFFSVTCDSFIPRLVYSFDIPFKH